MAILGIYSDAHFSISSSILNRISGFKYSMRLDCLVDSFRWMYEQFKENNVDVIVNCGDLTDSDILHAEENAALYEALAYNPGIDEFYILGNHEIKNKNSTIASTSILNGYPNISIFNNIEKLEFTHEHTTFVLVPYLTDKDDYERVYKALDELSDREKVYVFSHMSYVGENLNNYVLTDGLDKTRMMNLYPNVKGIFNGHLHNTRDEGIYHQIGSLISSSFGDNYTEGLPGIIIYNTETDEIKRIPNPYAILFKKISCNSFKDLSKDLQDISCDNQICLRVEVPASIKDETYDFIEQYKDKYKIVEYRIKSKYEPSKILESNEIESIAHYKSPYDALKGYLDVQDSLPYEKNEMVGFLDKYIGA